MVDEDSGCEQPVLTAESGKGEFVDASVVEATRNPRFTNLFADWSPMRLGLISGLSFLFLLGGLCGWLGYRIHQQRQADDFRALLVQVGKQAALNLTTIDHEHADADVQRILDSATGDFYDDFKNRSAPFVDVVKKVQSKSVGTITEAGLESINGKQGQVLVAVTVNTTSMGTPDERPRYWRMRLAVGQEGNDVKVSKVDFVP